MNGIFETIEPQPEPGRWSRPQATMTAKGHIKISRVAFELLGEPTHVQVLFDSASQTIALKRADKHDTNTHLLLSHGVHGRHGGRLIKVYNLMERIEAELFTCMRFKDVRLDNYGRLVLELCKAVPGFNGQRIGVYKEWKDRRYSERNERRRDQRRLQREEKLAAEAKERETDPFRRTPRAAA